MTKKDGPRHATRRRIECGLALFLLAAAVAPAGANVIESGDPSAIVIDASPEGASAEEIAMRWNAALAIERELFESDIAEPETTIPRLERAAALFSWVAAAERNRARAYWRASRATWVAGEMLPLGEDDAKIERFEQALLLSDEGLQVEPDCAECMLWKFTSLGRLRTTRGLFEGARQVPEMGELLDQAIALEPTHSDSPDNSTLGNLHYASAVYYRLLPDWFWVGWVLGIKGDKERALEHSRTALALHPNRLDYQVEVGTQLLCLGTVKQRKNALAEGKRVLERAIARTASSEDERREVFFAKQLLAEPEKACGYTGDALVEIDEKAAKQARD